jgi:hypothetical protein
MTTGTDLDMRPTKLKRLGRHKSYAVMDEYLEVGDAFEGHPLAGAALFVTSALCWAIWAGGQGRAVCIRRGAFPAAMFLASKGCFYAAMFAK